MTKYLSISEVSKRTGGGANTHPVSHHYREVSKA